MRVFYSKLQTVNSDFDGSPSFRKSALVVQAWKKINAQIQIIKPRSLSAMEIAVAHDPKFVNGVLGGRINNGFGNRSMAISKALPWCVGSFVSAAVYACENQICTFSPTSGFHHAKYSHAAGFCTFNALTIAAIQLKQRKLAKRVGILDLDSHAGDGTEQTLDRTDSHDFVEHYSLGYQRIDLFNNQQWLDHLPQLLRERFSDCDVLFYQAGVNCHIDDPLVDQGQFTSEQLAIRDRHVFETAKSLNLPVVTNLAGGYQTPLEQVIELHTATALAYAQSIT